MATALNKQLWLKDFAGLMFAANSFYKGAKDDSASIKEYGNIVLPQSSATNTVTEITSATSLPLAINKAAATFTEYTPIMLGFTPFFVQNLDETEFSFDLRKEYLADNVGYLLETAEKYIGTEWTVTASGSIIATTGTARTNTFGNASAKAVKYANIVAAATLLDRQNVPRAGRRLAVTPTFLADIILMPEFIDKDITGKAALVDGFVGRIAGFDVYMTSQLGSFVAAGTKKLYNASNLATDLEAAVAFHPSTVRYGMGTKETGGMNIKFTDPTGYFNSGGAVEGWVRVGATTKYGAVSNIVKGVVTIKEVV